MKKTHGILLTSAILLCAAIAGLWTSLAVRHLNQPQRTFHYPIQFVEKLKNNPHAGKKIYQEYCAACHDPEPLIAVNAPRFGHREDWQAYARLDMQTLLAITSRGVSAMPARGGCFECDDALLEQAIRYILAR